VTPAGLSWTAAAASLGLCLTAVPDHAIAAYNGYGYYGSSYGYGDPYRYRRAAPAVRRSTEPTGTTTKAAKPAAPPPPVGPLIIAVSIGNQHVTVYDDGNPVASSSASTGVPGHPTPMGVFSVIQKDRYHHSNIYSGAPMPYMQRITWSGVALHLGVVPGHPASHGCIRLPDAMAARLWGMTQLGARVIVSPGEVTPYDISHKLLTAIGTKPTPPAPEPEPAAVPEAAAPPASAEVKSVANTMDPPSSGVLTIAPATADSTKPDGAGPALIPSASGETPPVMLASLAPVDRIPLPMAKPDKPMIKAGFISLFVSRKEGKLFVRKGFEPLFDVPVTIANRDQPFGTHVFTAARTADGSGFRWIAVSLATERPTTETITVKGRTRTVTRNERTGMLPQDAQKRAALQALDRIELPPEVLARVTPYMEAGASLLIGDDGLGRETGKDTDFIALLR
jgi:lipoprotein-anchoring transpeptidase ErfK/SrfK